MSTPAPAPVPEGEAGSVQALRRLLESDDAGAIIDSAGLPLERLVGHAAGDLLRRCAVPHEFDCELLAWIAQVGPAEAEELYAQFTELSIMQVSEASLSIHERWREPLWRWWLAEPQRETFASLSRRLVTWFTQPVNPTGEDPAVRRRMFHLLGCDRAEGMKEFDRLFRAARYRRRFSECSLLVRLVHEYDSVLDAAEAALLSYQEGKIALDMRQWDLALPMLRAVVDTPSADPLLRVHGQVRIGHALRQLKRLDEARRVLEQAMEQLGREPTAELARWRIFYELGETERDIGEVDSASSTLSRALSLAKESDRDVDTAGVHNSLGTVQLRLRDVDAAVASFEASLEALDRRGDILRKSAVFNNLGLAQLERCDWTAAAAAFASSLATKRGAGDLVGQATTLLNLSRAHAAQSHIEDALAAAEEARRLFDQGGDHPGAEVAQQTLHLLKQRAVGPGESHPRLPWWAWLLIVSGILLLVMLAIERTAG